MLCYTFAQRHLLHRGTRKGRSLAVDDGLNLNFKVYERILKVYDRMHLDLVWLTLIKVDCYEIFAFENGILVDNTKESSYDFKFSLFTSSPFPQYMPLFVCLFVFFVAQIRFTFSEKMEGFCYYNL
jgi:hypothetical protein